MLRKILLVIAFVLNTQSFAQSYVIKYEDYIREKIITESFTKQDDFKNRLSELWYSNHGFIHIIQIEYLKSKISPPIFFIDNYIDNFIDNLGGEGMGN